MRKLIIALAVFALVLGVSVKSSQAVNLGGYAGKIKFKYSDWTDIISVYDTDSGGYGNANGSEDFWGIYDVTSILKDDGTNQVIWQKGDDGEYLTGIYYNLDDDFWEIDAGTGKQNTQLVGGSNVNDNGDLITAGRLDLWLDTVDDFDASLGIGGRTALDKYTNITDGTASLYLATEFATGIKFGGIAPTTLDDHIVLDNDIDPSTQFATGDGSFFLNVIGGSAADVFDTNGYNLTDDSGNTNILRDFKGEFDTEVVYVPGTILPDGTEPFEILSEDPVRGAIKPIPEPTTVALLGIGLVGMAGVAVRKKLKKKEVEA